MKKKVISVLGDSVSTFQGITPEGAAFYGSWNREETGIITPEDTWWMKVTGALGGRLGMNNSIAGSMVTGGSLVSGTSPRRIMDLSSNGTPDVILIFIGANDWGFRVLPQEFEAEYRRMIAAVKLAYPYAAIWCSTLPEAEEAPDDLSFFDVDGCISKKVYSDIIKRAAADADVNIADLAAYGESYPTIDGVHPNREGMTVLADLWIRELK